MVEDDTTASFLQRIHSSLQQGRGEEAEALLAHLLTHESCERTPEMDYLLAWCAGSCDDWALMEQRVEAFSVTQDPHWSQPWHLTGTVRRRRPGSLLLLGNAAFLLGHPLEALTHYEQCLRLLDERRMNIPEVRRQAYLALGKLTLSLGNALQAITYYETALSLGEQDSLDPLLLSLSVDLCEACYQRQLFSKALSYGQHGLLLLEEKGEHHTPLTLLLSKICLSLQDWHQAFAYAEQAWHLASAENNVPLLAEILLVKATVCFAEDKGQRAFSFCEQALKMGEKQNQQNASLLSKITLLCGQIIEAEWHHHPEDTQQAEAAMRWYEQAWNACASLEVSAPLLIEIASHQALLCEARGQPAQALVYWKKAYRLAEPMDGRV